jgi:hypothetical protein
VCRLWFLDLFVLLWIIRGITNNRRNRVITNTRFNRILWLLGFLELLGLLGVLRR